MRILFLSHNFPPEVNAPATRTFEHCVRWARAGHHVTVVTCAPNWPGGTLYPGYKNTFRRQVEWVEGVRVVRVWTYLAPNAGRFRRIVNYLSYMLCAVLASIRLPRPDVVIATSPQFFCGWAGVIVARMKRAPLVLEIRDLWPDSIRAVGAMRNRLLLRILELLERAMYRSARRIVTVGAGYRARILEKVDLQDRISVVTNGVDLERFVPHKPDRRLRRTWNLDGQFVCSYVGTIGMAHGLEVVLEAAKTLKNKDRRDIAFCLVGDGASRKPLEEQVERAGLNDMVVFAGRQPKERIPAILAASDACLIHLKELGLFETVIPSKMFEIMAMNRPIIMGVRGEARDIVLEAGAGLVMKPGSAESLIRAVETLADRPDLASSLGRAARQYVAAHYNRDALAARYLKLLQRIANTRAAGTSRVAATPQKRARLQTRVPQQAARVQPRSGTNTGPACKRADWRQWASRWWSVLRYYRVSQMAMRLVSTGRRWSVRLTGARRYCRPYTNGLKLRHNPSLRRLAGRKLAERRGDGAAENAAKILRGRYRFLNEERTFVDGVDWRLSDWPQVARLWRFHLHYHEFLLDLAAEALRTGEPMWHQRAWRLVTDWIGGNHPGDPRALADAWHPYCISRRLPVWILLWSACPPGEELHDRVLGSIFSQASFLQRHLERDVRGNHLLENARALVLAGAFLDGPSADRWLKAGQKILRRELAEQILPHGEHFERSPMYHAQVLEALLDTRDAAGLVVPELAELCGETSARMAGWLRSILHPDGELPLLGDTCLGETTAASHLISRATSGSAQEILPRREPTRASAQSASARVVGDCWIYRHGKDFVIFDAGPVGANHLPAHAHADLLSLEASFRGRRLLVDSGVFNYALDAMRAYCRSSAAHNVLQIDAEDQCDMWSRFRMGYRGWPRGLKSGETHGFHWARATHNAYRRLGVPKVGRWLACRPGGPWLCVDWALGKGRRRLSSRSDKGLSRPAGLVEHIILIHGEDLPLLHNQFSMDNAGHNIRTSCAVYNLGKHLPARHEMGSFKVEQYDIGEFSLFQRAGYLLNTKNPCPFDGKHLQGLLCSDCL